MCLYLLPHLTIQLGVPAACCRWQQWGNGRGGVLLHAYSVSHCVKLNSCCSSTVHDAEWSTFLETAISALTPLRPLSSHTLWQFVFLVLVHSPLPTGNGFIASPPPPHAGDHRWSSADGSQRGAALFLLEQSKRIVGVAVGEGVHEGHGRLWLSWFQFG